IVSTWALCCVCVPSRPGSSRRASRPRPTNCLPAAIGCMRSRHYGVRDCPEEWSASAALQRIGAYRAALGCRLRCYRPVTSGHLGVRDGGCLFSQPSILARATAIASSRDPSKGTFVELVLRG